MCALQILILDYIPLLSRNLLAYGPRTAATAADSSRQRQNGTQTGKQNGNDGGVEQMLQRVVSRLQVPHAWFSHFYIASLASSAFWGLQLAMNGAAVRRLCAVEASVSGVSPSTAMSANQVALIWLLLALQAARRLYECRVLFAAPSQSRMFVAHWALGIFFYVALGVAVWIEGAGTFPPPSPLSSGSSKRNKEIGRTCPLNQSNDVPASLHLHKLGTLPIFTLRLAPPSAKTLIGIPIFLMASGVQHDCHAYLSSLRKYTRPSHPYFAAIRCPHYTAECVIYASLAVIASPDGQWVNRTVLAATVFVVVNLGVTAKGVEEWDRRVFGEEKGENGVKHTNRWRMLPFLW